MYNEVERYIHQIIAALRLRDPAEARQVMLAHIQNARGRVLGSALPDDEEFILP